MNNLELEIYNIVEKANNEEEAIFLLDRLYEDKQCFEALYRSACVCEYGLYDGEEYTYDDWCRLTSLGEWMDIYDGYERAIERYEVLADLNYIPAVDRIVKYYIFESFEYDKAEESVKRILNLPDNTPMILSQYLYLLARIYMIQAVQSECFDDYQGKYQTAISILKELAPFNNNAKTFLDYLKDTSRDNELEIKILDTLYLIKKRISY